jgi:hypothetical protein
MRDEHVTPQRNAAGAHVAKVKGEVNAAEQGETANIQQNTTNAGFFKGRRVK